MPSDQTVGVEDSSYNTFFSETQSGGFFEGHGSVSWLGLELLQSVCFCEVFIFSKPSFKL